jgi:hypothetical protein
VINKHIIFFAYVLFKKVIARKAVGQTLKWWISSVGLTTVFKKSKYSYFSFPNLEVPCVNYY